MKSTISIQEQAAVAVAESQECFELNIQLGAGLISWEQFRARFEQMIESELVALTQRIGSEIDPELMEDPWEAA